MPSAFPRRAGEAAGRVPNNAAFPLELDGSVARSKSKIHWCRCGEYGPLKAVLFFVEAIQVFTTARPANRARDPPSGRRVEHGHCYEFHHRQPDPQPVRQRERVSDHLRTTALYGLTNIKQQNKEPARRTIKARTAGGGGGSLFIIGINFDAREIERPLPRQGVEHGISGVRHPSVPGAPERSANSSNKVRFRSALPDRTGLKPQVSRSW